MEPVGVAATLHDTSGLLVYNLDLIVVDHIFHILFKQGVCLQQLVDSVHTLRLDGIVLHEVVLALLTIGRRKRIITLHFRQL